MKSRIFWIAAAILALLLVADSCGKGKGISSSQNQASSQEQTQQQEPTITAPVSGLTEEDYYVIAMSPEDRWDYLFAKFQRMVKERYGVDIDYEPYPGKRVSGFGDEALHRLWRDEGCRERIIPMKLSRLV